MNLRPVYTRTFSFACRHLAGWLHLNRAAVLSLVRCLPFGGENRFQAQVSPEYSLFGTFNILHPLPKDGRGFVLICEQTKINAQVCGGGLGEIHLTSGAVWVLPFELEPLAPGSSPGIVKNIDFGNEQLHLGVSIKFVCAEPFNQAAKLC